MNQAEKDRVRNKPRILVLIIQFSPDCRDLVDGHRRLHEAVVMVADRRVMCEMRQMEYCRGARVIESESGPLLG